MKKILGSTSCPAAAAPTIVTIVTLLLLHLPLLPSLLLLALTAIHRCSQPAAAVNAAAAPNGAGPTLAQLLHGLVQLYLTKNPHKTTWFHSLLTLVSVGFRDFLR